MTLFHSDGTGAAEELAFLRVRDELASAMSKFKPFNSAHEAYAVIAEEVDELWDEVKKHQDKRDYDRMGKECIQVAAMAVRMFLEVVESKTRGHEKIEPKVTNPLPGYYTHRCKACGVWKATTRDQTFCGTCGKAMEKIEPRTEGEPKVKRLPSMDELKAMGYPLPSAFASPEARAVAEEKAREHVRANGPYPGHPDAAMGPIHQALDAEAATMEPKYKPAVDWSALTPQEICKALEPTQAEIDVAATLARAHEQNREQHAAALAKAAGKEEPKVTRLADLADPSTRGQENPAAIPAQEAEQWRNVDVVECYFCKGKGPSTDMSFCVEDGWYHSKGCPIVPPPAPITTALDDMAKLLTEFLEHEGAEGYSVGMRERAEKILSQLQKPAPGDPIKFVTDALAEMVTTIFPPPKLAPAPKQDQWDHYWCPTCIRSIHVHKDSQTPICQCGRRMISTTAEKGVR